MKGKKIFFSLLALTFTLVALMSFASATSVTLADYVLDADGVASNVHASVSAGTFTSGVGVGTVVSGTPDFGTDGAFGDTWSTTTLDSTDYFEITLSPQSGYSLDISAINFGERRSLTGIRNYQVQWSKSSSFTSPTTIATVSVLDDDLERSGNITGLNINVANGETIYIRWFGYGAEMGAGTWRINDATLNIVGDYESSLSLSSSTMVQSSNSTTFTVTNDGNTPLSNIVLTSTGDFNVTLSSSTISSLAAGANSTITATRTAALSSLAMGTNTVTINATAADGTTSTGTITLENSFCSDGDVNETDLTLKVEVKNKGEGEDDKWLPLDNIEIEVELENDKTDVDLSDVVFELGLFKEGTSTNAAPDMIWISEDDEAFNFGDIDEGDKGKHVFEFRIDPAEIDSGDYLLMVKAYEDGKEDELCTGTSNDLTTKNYYTEISVDKETSKNKMVVIDESLLSVPMDALCGEQTTLNFDVWNIGDTDFADQFLVTLFNTALGLNLNETYVGDLDAGETASLSFVLDIPADAEAKTTPYTLEMQTFYEYDVDGGKYETYYDRKSENTFDALLKVGGNCIVSGEAIFETDEVDIVSGGKAGEPLIVKTTIKNSGTKTADYIVSVEGNYSLWASSAIVDTKTFTLNAGESKEITITLDVKKGISGEQTFDVEVVSGNKVVMTQPFSVLVEGSSGLFEGITGSAILGGGSSYLWIIGLVNVILIGSIIIVAVRLLRR